VPSEPDTNFLIVSWKNGEVTARDRLIAKLHPELSQIAAARLRSEYNSSLSTGDLINDAVVRLLQADCAGFTDRQHLVALSSRLMRHILIEHARQKATSKRDHIKVELCTRVDGGQRFDLISLETALVRLGAIDPALMGLVEMRYFGGMTVTDVASVTGWSEKTVKRRWHIARAWLIDALARDVQDA
jgi:RNA polymerase sigma factor (TIGR02999 family)